MSTLSQPSQPAPEIKKVEVLSFTDGVFGARSLWKGFPSKDNDYTTYGLIRGPYTSEEEALETAKLIGGIIGVSTPGFKNLDCSFETLEARMQETFSASFRTRIENSLLVRGVWIKSFSDNKFGVLATWRQENATDINNVDYAVLKGPYSTLDKAERAAGVIAEMLGVSKRQPGCTEHKRTFDQFDRFIDTKYRQNVGKALSDPRISYEEELHGLVVLGRSKLRDINSASSSAAR